MRRDERFVGRPLCVRVSFKERGRRFGRSFERFSPGPLYTQERGPAVVLYFAICACLLLWFPQPKRIVREKETAHLIPSASTTSVW
jgi:hypothetical protein